jgi:SSS family transporter
MVELHTLDYIAIGGYMLLMAFIGLFLGWFIKDAGAYLKGSGTIPWIVAGISNFMSLFSTFVFVAYAGVAYEHGLISVTVMWSTVPACIFGSIWMAKRWRRAGINSPVEYLERRFNAPVRQIVAWSGLLMRLLDNMVRLYAIGVFLCAVTPLSLVEAIVVSGIIVTLFTILGGIWAVTVMGTVQFVVLMFITLILLPLSVSDVGGIAGISEKIPQHLHWFNGPKGAPLWLFVYFIMIIIKYNENWAFIQRFYCVRDEKAAMKGGYLTAALFVVSPIIFLLPAVAAKVMFPDLPDKEMAYVAVSVKLLPPGLMGVMVASMFAATMSSLNAEYNVISSVLTTDVYKRIFRPKASEKELLLSAQVFTLIVGTLVLLGGVFIKDFGGAFEANKLFTGIFAIPVGVPLVFGLLMKRPTPQGAILTVVIGSVAGILLNLMPNLLSWEMATLIETMICFIVFIFSGYSRNERQDYLARVNVFFKQINTPITENEKPVIESKLKDALIGLFVISLALSGLLFVVVAFPSISTDSGKYSLISGVICFFSAGLLLFWRRRNPK